MEHDTCLHRTRECNIYIYIYIYIEREREREREKFGWLSFYSISNFEGYLMPNPFLYN